ncbi:MAG: hypothetical protein WDO06_08370 [Actinomycetota bacterium]
MKWIAGALASVLLLSSCGTPSQKYAASKSEGVYFTVPQEWHEISMKELSALESTSKAIGAAEKLSLVKWQAAYTPNKKIQAKQVFSIKPTTEPLVFVRVRDLFPDEINSISYNTLRDVVEPLTDWVSNPDASTPEFNVVDDFEVKQPNARGVHTIYDFVVDGVSQTIDQVSLMSLNGQKIYVLVLRCTTKCYDKNRKLLAKISKSFTVRGKK